MAKSPLLIGSDVRSINASSLEILKATEIIAINQDPLGIQASLLSASPVDPRRAGERWTFNEWAGSPGPEPEVYTWKKGIDGM